mmetsp:Transcript_10587/g.21909  ORF Transcript_10587/g.21909 Transcript_10587/m.21909 type:complete len:291 (-) Transcript_10587:59-931(-)
MARVPAISRDARRLAAAAMSFTALALFALAALVVHETATGRTALEFANANDYLDGYVWEPPYPGAGPETPEWAKTPGSVGQDAPDVNDPAHREHNVLGNDYMYPDYARKPRTTGLAQLPFAVPVKYLQRPQLWVGSPQKMLPPDGDYPGGQTGIPLDGYLAYETGWANDGPFHGELAPMQEAGIANQAKPSMLSIMDGDSLPDTFNDWALGNQAADLDQSYDPGLWEHSGQPIDEANMGKITCNMGTDCHDGTHQGGVHDNARQFYDQYHYGSIDPNSPESVNGMWQGLV